MDSQPTTSLPTSYFFPLLIHQLILFPLAHCYILSVCYLLIESWKSFLLATHLQVVQSLLQRLQHPLHLLW